MDPTEGGQRGCGPDGGGLLAMSAQKQVSGEKILLPNRGEKMTRELQKNGDVCLVQYQVHSYLCNT